MKLFKKHSKDNSTTKETSIKMGNLKDIMDGTVLTKEFVVKQLPFVLYLTLLAIIYIANRYQAEKLVRDTIQVQAEVKELKSEAIAVASELMKISKQSVVVDLVTDKNLGLIESRVPPKKIILNE
jgi:hypothetical protein